jgi:2-polyprenyl-6-hydroxyphenyl methylase/3-demethylubiquinone-9 3-methyltransferase
MTTASTASPEEVAKFEGMADTWWDPTGPFRPLHKFNPARIRYIRDRLADRYDRDIKKPQPFAGLSLLDIGCGGGLVAEPMARLGFNVTGIDAAEKNVDVARIHAARSNLDISYEAAAPEELLNEKTKYDVVLSLEVVEHVTDLNLFLEAASNMVAPNGVLIAATLNRTLKSLALAKIGAEYILRWLPPGTHDWRKFVKPSELTAALRRCGMAVADITGLTYDIMTDTWVTGGDLGINYIVFSTRSA